MSELQVVRVDHPADPRLRDYTSLTDGALRRVMEPAEGLFIAEGEKVVLRALEAGYAPRSALMEERWLPGLAEPLARAGVPVYLADQPLMEALTGYTVHRGALASMQRRPLPSTAELMARCRSVAVLEDVVNHTNVGAVFRAAAALGIEGVLLTPRCADPLYRRSVKVSMGASFTLPYARFERWPDCYRELSEAGFRLLAMTPAADAVALPELVPGSKDALLLGTEGEGLSPQALAAADLRVQIPMEAGIDSLNVASAAAVVFYAMRWNRC
ncbi:tRNA G18 (ribose-2'-O)-methylase SpoU [Motilibacter peucedani]|uniref:tRNA G18 (Ribose-2'-O)-methylase SpoU n=1 Tax=Motilibacter peucedani TaxID=598650 RepID=A0A420XK00_9ACTN|nr:RNA methyltransferase [Motilibacter peucedani]RKS68019.1 tRNA G18 (ribose-2'-O)-methylase SpoU [Motilibacter peucedani]